jgi:hypothetical protein
MARLTCSRRKALPGKDFALPGRNYPIDTENHARNALVRGSQFPPPRSMKCQGG